MWDAPTFADPQILQLPCRWLVAPFASRKIGAISISVRATIVHIPQWSESPACQSCLSTCASISPRLLQSRQRSHHKCDLIITF